jgi:serine/threonine protein kinase
VSTGPSASSPRPRGGAGAGPTPVEGGRGRSASGNGSGNGGGSGGSGDPPRATSPGLGLVAGRYRLLERMAEGGMGVVYKAEHTLSRKKLAIKVLHPHLSHGRQAVERFKREVSAAAEIDHPGIVQVFDAGVDTDGSFYMAMELLEGESLGARTRRAWPGTRTAVKLIAEMCEPLAAAHAKGFVHRDLKPDNVFLAIDRDSGIERVKVLDFGLVREVGRRGPTMTGITFGTPEYMSPEQAMSAKKAGIRSDVWSIGVMLYELLAGRHPFTGETPNAVMANAIKDPHPPLADIAPHVPAELALVVESCLAKEPKQRPADAGELGARLNALVATVQLDERGPESPTLRSQEGDREDGLDGGGAGALDDDLLATSSPLPLALRDPPLRDREALAKTRHTRPERRPVRWPWVAVGAGALGVVAVLAIVIWNATTGESRIVARPLPQLVRESSIATPSVVEAGIEIPPAPVGPEGEVPAIAAAPVVPVTGLEPPSSGALAPDPEELAGEPAAASEELVIEEPRRRRSPGRAASASDDDAPSALEDARACLARADSRCAVRALEGATSAAELALLVDVYQSQGRASDARAVMQRYVRRYPRGGLTARYRRELGLAGAE